MFNDDKKITIIIGEYHITWLTITVIKSVEPIAVAVSVIISSTVEATTVK